MHLIVIAVITYLYNYALIAIHSIPAVQYGNNRMIYRLRLVLMISKSLHNIATTIHNDFRCKALIKD